jgi:hypothetical protein
MFSESLDGSSWWTHELPTGSNSELCNVSVATPRTIAIEMTTEELERYLRQNNGVHCVNDNCTDMRCILDWRIKDAAKSMEQS